MPTKPQHDTTNEVETREQTIARLGTAGNQEADPTSRRRLGRRALSFGHGLALAAGIVAFVVVVVLAGGSVAFGLALGGGAAIGIGVIAALVLAEREDGRIERSVEASDREAETGELPHDRARMGN